MLGLKLISQAIRMLAGNIWVTVQITMLPLAIGYGLALGANYLLFGPEFYQIMTGAQMPVQADQKLFLGLFISLIIIVPVFCWSAVAWHRYVLLKEPPTSVLPKIHWPGIRSYFWNGVKIAFVVFLTLLPIFLLFYLFRDLILSNPFASPFMLILIMLVLFLFGLPAVLRMALVLPAAAIAKPLSLKGAWTATKGYFPALIIVTLMFAVLNWVTGQFSGPGWVNMALFAFSNWLRYALGVSVVTALYSTCIEKRAS